MPRDINKRLDALRSRRRGEDQLSTLTFDERREVLAKSLLLEDWQRRATDKPNTRYALGAMQEVGADYTRIGIETAERVGNQLLSGLASENIKVKFRLQGSVPLNVHIRGFSDIDLLVLSDEFLTYATRGVWSERGIYQSPTDKTSIGVLGEIRKKSESILERRFYAADVNKNGGKAISISGGSLPRSVDVVPAHWHDTVEYQLTSIDYNRGVTILDKNVPVTIDNLPFLHIHKIEERDRNYLGGLKKSIRLCKNVKSDAIREGSTIKLPSFDIASLLYHAESKGLIQGHTYELSILSECQRYFDYLYHNVDYARNLMVPDGSRKILNSEEKIEGMKNLSIELDDLLREVAKENSALLRMYDKFSLPDARSTISSSVIPIQ